MQGRQDIRLYYGTRNTGATAYSDLDDNWKSVGVETVHVYSDDNKGYVQDILSQVILTLSGCEYYMQAVSACRNSPFSCCQGRHGSVYN